MKNFQSTRNNFTEPTVKKFKYGIYPGSFDPLHDGHLIIINLSIQQLDLKKVFFLPIINLRKNQTNLSQRIKKLEKFFQNNKKIIILKYLRIDYWNFIEKFVGEHEGNFFRLMGETCYNGYPEVGIPPSRDEPDTLKKILTTQHVVIMPNPANNHFITRPSDLDKRSKKIIILKIAKGKEKTYPNSESQKIKIYPFLGLKELKYNQYYLHQRPNSTSKDFDGWERRYWNKSIPKIGLSHGTFDEIHDGHISLWEESVRQLKLDALFVWPSLNPLHKPNSKSYDQRLEILQDSLKSSPRIHVLIVTGKNANQKHNRRSINTVESIFNYHEPIVDWIKNNLPSKTKFYRIFGSDSINDYLSIYKKNPNSPNPLVTMLGKGKIAVIERDGFPLKTDLVDGIIKLKRSDSSKYFSGLSSSLIRELNNKYGNLEVRKTESKHLPQNLFNKKALLFDDLAKKVNYKYSRLGVHKMYNHMQDVRCVQSIVRQSNFRPVKFVITRDSRIWADNTHHALASLIKWGKNVKIKNIPHYYVDLRSKNPTIINRPQSLVNPNLEIAIRYAIGIQNRLNLGWRSPSLSFTVDDVFTIGNYHK